MRTQHEFDPSRFARIQAAHSLCSTTASRSLAPPFLVASLFALLDLTGVAWVWLCSFAGGYAVLASAMATQKQLSTIDPITTFLWINAPKTGLLMRIVRLALRPPWICRETRRRLPWLPGR